MFSRPLVSAHVSTETGPDEQKTAHMSTETGPTEHATCVERAMRLGATAVAAAVVKARMRMMMR